MKAVRLVVMVMVAIVVVGCPQPVGQPTGDGPSDAGPGDTGPGDGAPSYSVTYDGNDHTAGSPPTDANAYDEGDLVTVKGAPLGFGRSGYEFDGWTTQADGSGTRRAAGSSFDMPAADVTLYAQWEEEDEPDSPGLTKLGSWTSEWGEPGIGLGLFVDPPYAYVTAGNGGLKIFHVGSGTPTPLAMVETSDWAEDVVVHQDYAYVAVNGDGVAVYDVGNPVAPSFVTTVDPGGTILSIAVGDDTLFVSDTLNTLYAVDISTPWAPVVLDSLSGLADDLEDLAYAGGYVYGAADTEGMLIIDAGTPSALQQVVGGHYKRTGMMNNAQSVTVGGGYVWVADFGGGLYAVDVSDPGAPALAGYSAGDSYASVVVAGGYAYTNPTADLDIFEISGLSAASPPLLSPTATADIDDNDTPNALFVAGSSLYATGANTGLSVLDISNGGSPTLTGFYNFMFAPADVLLAGDTLFVTFTANTYRYGRVESFDLSNPGEPARLDSYQTDATPYSLALSGDMLLVGSNSELLILDASNPSSLSYVGTYGGFLYQGDDVAMSGDLAYVAASASGLQVIDISTPTSPTRRDWYYAVGYSADTVALYDNYAYVGVKSGLQGGLMQVLDVRAPDDISFVRTIDLGGNEPRFAVVGDKLVAVFRRGMKVFDLSADPSNPAQVQSKSLSDNTPEVAVAGSYVYVANTGVGLQVFHVADVGPPIATYADVDVAGRTTVSGTMVVMATPRDPETFVVLRSE